MKRFIKLEEIPICWDRFLQPNECLKDMEGIWHIGLGTDLDSFVFRANLTERDREFLEALRVGVEDGV